ncbi:TPA: hypothetical protein ACLA4D_001973 [Neisseria meningitidis]|uniref:hypothetical protein n=1 Tax=Neisseria meningitidis TaxID=487 RepID=UPI0022A97C80|nr:hypothetical protein [Neisseria meningitidis]
MNKNYLFYLIQNIKSIFLIGGVFFGLLIFSGLWGNDFKLSFLGVIDFIFGMVGGWVYSYVMVSNSSDIINFIQMGISKSTCCICHINLHCFLYIWVLFFI